MRASIIIAEEKNKKALSTETQLASAVLQRKQPPII